MVVPLPDTGPAWPAHNGQVRRKAEPRLDAWLATLLPDPATVGAIALAGPVVRGLLTSSARWPAKDVWGANVGDHFWDLRGQFSGPPDRQGRPDPTGQFSGPPELSNLNGKYEKYELDDGIAGGKFSVYRSSDGNRKDVSAAPLFNALWERTYGTLQ